MSGSKKKINHRTLFKKRTQNDDNEELTHKVIISARKTGNLNLSSKGIFSVPKKVWSLNELTEEEIKDIHLELDYEHKHERWWEQELLKILDLSSNSISTIDPEIERLCELLALDLHDNNLETLPPQLGNLCNLKKLDLSSNKLKVLPVNFYKLSELRELNIKNNLLKELNSAIGDLVMLTNLDISHNYLKQLPIGMGYLVRLLSLNISHNQLKELPADIMSMRALLKLDASCNQLEIVPSLNELRKIEIIMLHTNNIKNIPNISCCNNLKEIHLANNSINEIDTECLEGLGVLKILTLGHNKIETVPEDMMKLINLEVLDLSYNKITSIPNFIGILPKLKKFSIDGNNIKNVRNDIIRCGTSRIVRHIRQNAIGLNINAPDYMQTENNKFPDKYRMKSTKLLSLVGQGLVLIPDDVIENALAAEVTIIDISKNKLTELSSKFSSIKTVIELKLSSNSFNSIPDWLGENYKYLQYLDLSRNHFNSLPRSMDLLVKLREIDISYNKFAEMPECLGDIENLEIIIANDNQISHINIPLLTKLNRLATLNLSNNNIGYVPPELGKLTNLRILELSGNCFKYPRQAILMKDTKEILEYLRNRIPTEN
ncbi:leucine-rich repeat-containing protein 40-like [Prorops nasuta]|uniref:leucine-rich repeat-containing protein 40-like n=1 Tax=Prorops nasuta TaxID=863751 RepID=UPI0034CDD655